MLGSFLEIGVETADIAASFAAARALGFAALPVGDIRSEAYAVISDGGVCAGFYPHPYPGPSLTFVRPELAQYVRALRRRGIELEFARLGEQEFHELGFRDPGGQLVTLVEARTFSPPGGGESSPSVCGCFLEYSLATSSVEESAAFWEALGFAPVDGGAEPHPWRRMAGAGLTLGLYRTAPFPAGMTFAASQLPARLEFLRAKGYSAASGSPLSAWTRASATLTIDGGIPVYLVADPGDAD